jgi:hypothetical protein
MARRMRLRASPKAVDQRDFTRAISDAPSTQDRSGTLSRYGRSALWLTFVGIDSNVNWKKSDEKNVDGFCGRCGLIGRDWACDGSGC